MTKHAAIKVYVKYWWVLFVKSSTLKRQLILIIANVFLLQHH